MIREGDICLIASKGWVSRAISWWTKSAFTHAQLVTRRQEGNDPRSAKVIDVGWKIRETTIAKLNKPEFIALRPTLESNSVVPEELGREVAADTIELFRWLVSIGQTRYPWWKIPAYILPRSIRQRILIGGPRQVCSVFAIRPWVAKRRVGFFFYGDTVERVDDPAEIRAVTPADIEKNAVRRQWKVVHQTPKVPPLNSR